MNILFVDQFGDLGGAQQCMLDLIPGLLSRRWHVLAAVPESGGFAEKLTGLGAEVEPVHVGEYRSGSKSLSDKFRFLWRTSNLIRRLQAISAAYKPDVIYVNGPRVLPAAVLALRQTPIIFHAHSFLPPGLPRRLVNWSRARGNVRTIAVSRYVNEYLTTRPAGHIIPNGVPDLRRSREPYSGPPRIGIIGRIAPEKGQLAFVEAARLLPPNWRFVICGSASNVNRAYERELRVRASALPIEFLNWQGDIAAVLSNLDVLAVPSTAHEAAGRVIPEAFSAGVPVVAFPSGGIPEFVTDNETGLLTEIPTPESLAARIRQLMDDESMQQRLTRAARSAWEANYTLDLYRERVANVIAQAARTAPRPATHNTGE